MNRDFTTNVTGWLFLAAAAMLWAGWVLLPHAVGTYFQPADFAAINQRLYVWLWMYRIHMFGLVLGAMAVVALATLAEAPQARVLLWPGAAITAGGLLVAALATAFYYHHGVWGAVELRGKPPEAAQDFVKALRVDTEYVTCLVRFGRVFSGLGLLFVAAGLGKARLLPKWIPAGAAVLGFIAMAITMGIPDRLDFYRPVFHVLCLWLAATGWVVWRSGIRSA